MAQPTGGNLPPPPRFRGSGPGPSGGGNPMPQNIAEAVDFFRWLTSLWRKAADSIDSIQAIVIQPQQVNQGLGDRVLSEALAFSQANKAIPPPRESTPPPPVNVPRATPQELNALTLMGLTKVPYPLRPGQYGGNVLVGTRAARLLLDPVAYAQYEFYETDTTLIYISDGVHWLYVAGIYQRTQSQLAAFAAGLTGFDVGLLVDVTDYAHVLRWAGGAWTYNDPADQAGRIEGFLVDPNPTTGWHVCDGTTVNYLKSDGTTGSQALPDLISASANAAYLKFGSPANAAPNAAVAPTFTGGSFTPAGTISTPTLTMNSYTPAGTNNAPALTMNSYTPAGSVSVPTFTGSALGTHVHELPFHIAGTSLTWLSSFGTGGTNTAVGNQIGTAAGGSPTTELTTSVSAGTPSGTNSAPTFSGTPATLTGSVAAPTFTGNAATLTGSISTPTFTGSSGSVTGTIGSNGEPRNLVLRPWFRV